MFEFRVRDLSEVLLYNRMHYIFPKATTQDDIYHNCYSFNQLYCEVIT